MQDVEGEKYENFSTSFRKQHLNALNGPILLDIFDVNDDDGENHLF